MHVSAHAWAFLLVASGSTEGARCSEGRGAWSPDQPAPCWRPTPPMQGVDCGSNRSGAGAVARLARPLRSRAAALRAAAWGHGHYQRNSTPRSAHYPAYGALQGWAGQTTPHLASSTSSGRGPLSGPNGVTLRHPAPHGNPHRRFFQILGPKPSGKYERKVFQDFLQHQISRQRLARKSCDFGRKP